MDKDHFKGTGKQVLGFIKEAVKEITGDTKIEAICAAQKISDKA